MNTSRSVTMSQTSELPSPESTMALLKRRRSIRRYRPDQVPDEIVKQLLVGGHPLAAFGGGVE